jgi:hypothetical protein
MEKDIVKEIDSILLKNRNILKENFVAGKIKISEIELMISGFNFAYHTSQLKHEDGLRIFDFSYEYGIGKMDDGFIEIIKFPI